MTAALAGCAVPLLGEAAPRPIALRLVELPELCGLGDLGARGTPHRLDFAPNDEVLAIAGGESMPRRRRVADLAPGDGLMRRVVRSGDPVRPKFAC